MLQERPGHLRLAPGYASPADALELVLLRTGPATGPSEGPEAVPHGASEEHWQAGPLLPEPSGDDAHPDPHMRQEQHGQQQADAAASSAEASRASSVAGSGPEERRIATREPDLDIRLAVRRACSLSRHASTRDSSSSLIGDLKLTAEQQPRQPEDLAKQANGHSSAGPRPLQIRLESSPGTGHELGIHAAAQPSQKPWPEVPQAARGATIPWAQVGFHTPFALSLIRIVNCLQIGGTG